eukprot:gene790-10520_t
MPREGKKFTIPKKAVTRELLERCDENSREYKSISAEIEHSLWNSKCGLQINSIERVNNEQLVSQFNQKKLEMQKESTLRQQMIYGFKTVDNHDQAKKLCKTGLLTGNDTKVTCLGDPACGVYLSRCADVLRRFPLKYNKQMIMVVFQIIKGRILSIAEQHGNSGDLIEPTPDHEGHISRDFRKTEPKSVKNPSAYSRIFDSCQIYLYEMNNELEEFYVKRPRHCVPYAVVFYRLIQESPPELLAAEIISKVPVQRSIETNVPIAKPRPESSENDERYYKELENSLTVWTGKLYNKSTILTDQQLDLADENEALNSGGGTAPFIVYFTAIELQVSKRFDFSRCRIDLIMYSVMSLCVLWKQHNGVLKRGREYLHCEMWPQNNRSTKFALLKRTLKKRSEVLVLKLPQGYDLYIFPTGNLTKRLGITLEGYPETLHLLFSRKTFDEHTILRENHKFLKDARLILDSRLLELEKLKLTTPVAVPPPVVDVNDSESPFDDENEWTEYPLFFSLLEKNEITTRIQRARYAADKEMILSEKQRYKPIFKTPYFTTKPGGIQLLSSGSDHQETSRHIHEDLHAQHKQDIGKRTDPRYIARSKSSSISASHPSVPVPYSHVPQALSHAAKNKQPKDPRMQHFMRNKRSVSYSGVDQDRMHFGRNSATSHGSVETLTRTNALKQAEGKSRPDVISDRSDRLHVVSAVGSNVDFASSDLPPDIQYDSVSQTLATNLRTEMPRPASHAGHILRETRYTEKRFKSASGNTHGDEDIHPANRGLENCPDSFSAKGLHSYYKQISEPTSQMVNISREAGFTPRTEAEKYPRDEDLHYEKERSEKQSDRFSAKGPHPYHKQIAEPSSQIDCVYKDSRYPLQSETESGNKDGTDNRHRDSERYYNSERFGKPYTSFVAKGSAYSHNQVSRVSSYVDSISRGAVLQSQKKKSGTENKHFDEPEYRHMDVDLYPEDEALEKRHTSFDPKELPLYREKISEPSSLLDGASRESGYPSQLETENRLKDGSENNYREADLYRETVRLENRHRSYANQWSVSNTDTNENWETHSDTLYTEKSSTPTIVEAKKIMATEKPRDPRLKLSIPKISSDNTQALEATKAVSSDIPDNIPLSSISAGGTSSEACTSVSHTTSAQSVLNSQNLKASSERDEEKTKEKVSKPPVKDPAKEPRSSQSYEPKKSMDGVQSKAEENGAIQTGKPLGSKKLDKGAGSRFSTSHFWKQSSIASPQTEGLQQSGQNQDQNQIKAPSDVLTAPQVTLPLSDAKATVHVGNKVDGYENARKSSEKDQQALPPPPLPPVLRNLLSVSPTTDSQPDIPKESDPGKSQSVLYPAFIATPPIQTAALVQAARASALSTVPNHPIVRELTQRGVLPGFTKGNALNNAEQILCSGLAPNIPSIPLPAPPAPTAFMQSFNLVDPLNRSTNSHVGSTFEVSTSKIGEFVRSHEDDKTALTGVDCAGKTSGIATEKKVENASVLPVDSQPSTELRKKEGRKGLEYAGVSDQDPSSHDETMKREQIDQNGRDSQRKKDPVNDARLVFNDRTLSGQLRTASGSAEMPVNEERAGKIKDSVEASQNDSKQNKSHISNEDTNSERCTSLSSDVSTDSSRTEKSQLNKRRIQHDEHPTEESLEEDKNHSQKPKLSGSLKDKDNILITVISSDKDTSNRGMSQGKERVPVVAPPSGKEDLRKKINEIREERIKKQAGLHGPGEISDGNDHGENAEKVAELKQDSVSDSSLRKEKKSRRVVREGRKRRRSRSRSGDGQRSSSSSSRTKATHKSVFRDSRRNDRADRSYDKDYRRERSPEGSRYYSSSERESPKGKYKRGREKRRRRSSSLSLSDSASDLSPLSNKRSKTSSRPAEPDSRHPQVCKDDEKKIPAGASASGNIMDVQPIPTIEEMVAKSALKGLESNVKNTATAVPFVQNNVVVPPRGQTTSVNWYDTEEVMKYGVNEDALSNAPKANNTKVPEQKTPDKHEASTVNYKAKEAGEGVVSEDQIFDEIYSPSSPTGDFDFSRPAIPDLVILPNHAFDIRKPQTVHGHSAKVPGKGWLATVGDSQGYGDGKAEEAECTATVDMEISDGGGSQDSISSASKRRKSFDSEDESQEKADEMSTPDVEADNSHGPSIIMQSLMSSSQNAAKVLSKNLVIQTGQHSTPISGGIGKHLEAAVFSKETLPNHTKDRYKQQENNDLSSPSQTSSISKGVPVPLWEDSSASENRTQISTEKSVVRVSCSTNIVPVETSSLDSEQRKELEKNLIRKEKSGSLSRPWIGTPWMDSHFVPSSESQLLRKSKDSTAKSVKDAKGRNSRPGLESSSLSFTGHEHGLARVRHCIEHQENFDRVGSHSFIDKTRQRANYSLHHKDGSNLKTLPKKIAQRLMRRNSHDSGIIEGNIVAEGEYIDERARSPSRKGSMEEFVPRHRFRKKATNARPTLKLNAGLRKDSKDKTREAYYFDEDDSRGKRLSRGGRAARNMRPVELMEEEFEEQAGSKYYRRGQYLHSPSMETNDQDFVEESQVDSRRSHYERIQPEYEERWFDAKRGQVLRDERLCHTDDHINRIKEDVYDLYREEEFRARLSDYDDDRSYSREYHRYENEELNDQDYLQRDAQQDYKEVEYDRLKTYYDEKEPYYDEDRREIRKPETSSWSARDRRTQRSQRVVENYKEDSVDYDDYPVEDEQSDRDLRDQKYSMRYADEDGAGDDDPAGRRSGLPERPRALITDDDDRRSFDGDIEREREYLERQRQIFEKYQKQYYNDFDSEDQRSYGKDNKQHLGYKERSPYEQRNERSPYEQRNEYDMHDRERKRTGRSYLKNPRLDSPNRISSRRTDSTQPPSLLDIKVPFRPADVDLEELERDLDFVSDAPPRGLNSHRRTEVLYDDFENQDEDSSYSTSRPLDVIFKKRKAEQRRKDVTFPREDDRPFFGEMVGDEGLDAYSMNRSARFSCFKRV